MRLRRGTRIALGLVVVAQLLAAAPASASAGGPGDPAVAREAVVSDDSTANRPALYIDRFRNFYTGRCLAINLPSFNGQQAFQFDCNGRGYMSWDFQRVQLLNGEAWRMVSNFTGRCLAVQASANWNGSPVFEHDCLGYADQLWIRHDTYVNGVYQHTQMRNYYTGRCLAVHGASNWNGSPVFQYDCLGFFDQFWVIGG